MPADREQSNHSEAPKPFFSGGSGDPGASHDEAGVEPEDQVGPFRLLGILGEGGYGIVYERG